MILCLRLSPINCLNSSPFSAVDEDNLFSELDRVVKNDGILSPNLIEVKTRFEIKDYGLILYKMSSDSPAMGERKVPGAVTSREQKSDSK